MKSNMTNKGYCVLQDVTLLRKHDMSARDEEPECTYEETSDKVKMRTILQKMPMKRSSSVFFKNINVTKNRKY